jgi:LSD1 subclass zinc finger protein
MATAHDLLRERAVKARQLSQAQRRSLVFAKPAALIIGLLLSSVFAIGMASLFAHILGHSLGSIALQNRAYVSFSAGVALVALYAAVIVRTWREHRALTVAFCAVPPLIPNAPALCHICAAELTAPRGASIARCGYCFADNIVDIVWLQAKKKRLKLVFDDFIDEVARRAQQAERRHGRRRRLLLFAFFMAPPLAVASIQLLQTYAERRTARYVVVETGGAHCIARVAYSILGGRCIIGGPTRDAETCTLDRSVPEYQKDWDIHAFNDQVNLAVGVPDYAASAFVGRQVWVHYGVVGALKSVQKARGSRAYGYVAEIEISEGTRVKHKLSEL